MCENEFVLKNLESGELIRRINDKAFQINDFCMSEVIFRVFLVVRKYMDERLNIIKKNNHERFLDGQQPSLNK